jgi:sialate O-acetylesterase
MPATLRLPALFTDHLVLQRERAVPVWGWTSPKATVEATIQGLPGVSARGAADATGRFRIELPKMLAGGPYTLVVTSGDGSRRTVSDVMVGEVWLCSGQSNMEWSTQISGYSDAELNAINHPLIRLFHVPQTTALEVQEDVPTAWKHCDAAGVQTFSGVAYAFAVELTRALGVTVGLLQSAWGGTAAEWWTPISALDQVPELKPIADRYRAAKPPPRPGTPEHAALIKDWEQNSVYHDVGIAPHAQDWAKPGLDLAEWKTMALPQYWENAGLQIDGAVWFRKEVEIPPAWRGRDLTLGLGPIDDFDITYVGGVQVGSIGEKTPNAHTVPRSYTIPGRLVSSNSLSIAVRVFDRVGNGGIYGAASMMRVHPVGDDAAAVPLSGAWKYRIELRLEPKGWTPPPDTSDSPSAPERLWNGMLRPLAPFALRGAIWYQGESNADRAEQYRILMATMIRTWRAAWGHEFSFYQVQLAPFMKRSVTPQESAWAELREAQEQVASDLPGCDLAVIVDSGDEQDIHPRNKALVGRRLSRIALARDYGEPIEHSGPRLVQASYAGGGATLRFSHCQGGLAACGGTPIRGFAIAGADRKFVWAEAKLMADTVTVSSAQVMNPVAVRYGWADYPEGNLVNQDGLPARPFRTDTWPGVTSGKR